MVELKLFTAYRIVAKELDTPAYRKIGFALRDRQTTSLAVQRFMEYLDCRTAAGAT